MSNQFREPRSEFRPPFVPLAPRRDVRWAAREAKIVLAGSVAEVNQFCDFEIEEPRAVLVRLEAVAAIPLPGLSVTWLIAVGAGSTVDERRISGVVTDPATLLPLALTEACKIVRVGALLANAQLEDRVITVSAFVAPWGYAYGLGGRWTDVP